MNTIKTKVAASVAKLGRLGRTLGGLALVAGLMTISAGKAEAQWSTGFGGYGGYSSGMGMSPYDQELLKEQISGLNESQIELNLSNAYRARIEAELMWERMALAREQARMTHLQAYQMAKVAGVFDKRPAPAARTGRKSKVRRTPSKPAPAQGVPQLAAAAR